MTPVETAARVKSLWDGVDLWAVPPSCTVPAKALRAADLICERLYRIPVVYTRTVDQVRCYADTGRVGKVAVYGPPLRSPERVYDPDELVPVHRPLLEDVEATA